MTKYFISWQVPSSRGTDVGNLFYTIRDKLNEEAIKDMQKFILNNCVVNSYIKTYFSYEAVQFLSITKLDS